MNEFEDPWNWTRIVHWSRTSPRLRQWLLLIQKERTVFVDDIGFKLHWQRDSWINMNVVIPMQIEVECNTESETQQEDSG